MNKIYRLLTIILLTMLSACSTQSVKTTSISESSTIQPKASEAAVILDKSLAAPDLYMTKNSKTLKLTKIMEGGACKDNQQGALGLFRLYTNPDDVKRIKQSQNVGVFADFEKSIQLFSMQALQQAVDQLDFQSYLFEIDENKVKKNLATQLSHLFIQLISDDIAEFETNTTLMIDVSPLPDSLTIYLNGCEMAHDH